MKVRRPSPARWKIELRLKATELRSLDVVPMLLDWVGTLGFDAGHQDQLSLILGELFNNALDHGILHLDSGLKRSPDGFERYLDLRTKRLQALVSGTLKIELRRMARHGHEFLRICFKDSGKGFDYEKVLGSEPGTSTAPAGRGLVLVKSLGARIECTARGREVSVLYRLS